MVSNNYVLSVPTDGSSYIDQDLFINDTTETYEVSKSLILSNLSTSDDMQIIILDKDEDESLAGNGIYLPSGETLRLKNIGRNYTIKAKLASSGSASSLAVTCFNYLKVYKKD